MGQYCQREKLSERLYRHWYVEILSRDTCQIRSALSQFACGSAFQKGKNGLPDQIEIQGNYKDKLPEFIISKFGVAPPRTNFAQSPRPTSYESGFTVFHLPFAQLNIDSIFFLDGGKKVPASESPAGS